MPMLPGTLMTEKRHHQYEGYVCSLFSEGDRMTDWEDIDMDGVVNFRSETLRVSPATITHAIVWDRDMDPDFHKIIQMDIPITIAHGNNPIQLSIADIGFSYPTR